MATHLNTYLVFLSSTLYHVGGELWQPHGGGYHATVQSEMICRCPLWFRGGLLIVNQLCSSRWCCSWLISPGAQVPLRHRTASCLARAHRPLASAGHGCLQPVGRYSTKSSCTPDSEEPDDCFGKQPGSWGNMQDEMCDRLRQSRDVLWPDDDNRPALVDAQVVAVNFEMDFLASKSNWRSREDPVRRVVTAETVRKLCDQDHAAEAVEALGVLVQTGCCISKSLLYTVLKSCVVKKDLALGRRVHAFLVKEGYQSDTFLCNHILRMYASQGRLQDAMDVFTMVSEPDAFMWSSIISAHVKHGQDKQAIQLYHRMRSSVKPDGHVFVAVLQACARGSDLKTGQQVHVDVLATGVEPHLIVCNCLVDMYAKCRSLDDAQRLFDGLGQKDVVTWTALIAGYSQQGMGQEALRLYTVMQEERVAVPNSVTFGCLLQACASVGSPALEKGKQVHSQIRERGGEADVFLANSLVNMYAKCGSLEDAQTVFDRLGQQQKDVVTWTALIAGYSQHGMGQEALCLYTVMLAEGMTVPDSVTFVCLLQACASVGTPALATGKQLHTHIRERRLHVDAFLANSLIYMYAKCGSLEDAQKVFAGLGPKTVETWNVMITLYSQQGMGQEALGIYNAMQEDGISVPNSATFGCVLQACASLGTLALEKGRQLHIQIRERGHQANESLASGLINMYAKCGSLEDAQRVFDGLSEKTVVTWTALIAGYSQQGMGQEALGLYTAMLGAGLAVPNSVTFVCLLLACATVGNSALEMAKYLHTQIREQGHEADVCVASSLVDMYAKCGSLEDAQNVFDTLDQKDVVTWTALISGYTQQGRGQEALLLYSVMQEEGKAVPNCVTFVCLFQACAIVGTQALDMGKQLHAQASERGHQVNMFVANSLVNMYAKCGSVEDARSVFDGLGEKDVVTWNAMIGGYSQHGMGEEALCLYSAMQDERMVVPDSVTFMCLLQACSSVGTPALKKGEQLQARSRERGYEADAFVATSLLNMYGNGASLEDTLSDVQGLGQQDVLTCSVMIAVYSQLGKYREALQLFSAMQGGGIAVLNSLTIVCLLQACASLGAPALDMGMQLHAQVREQEHQADIFVASSLVNMYAKCGTMLDAQRVFDGLAQKDVVTWNAMIAGYSQQGMGQEALGLYSAMLEDDRAVPDSVTFACLLQACAHMGTPALEKGRQLHMQIREGAHQADAFVASSLVNMYAKCGSLEDAQRVFDGLSQKNLVTWTALIAGYSQQGMGEEAIHVYSAMQEEGIAIPDPVTFVCLLQACANVAALRLGRQLHAQIAEQGLENRLIIACSLINMYGKSGSMADAKQVFDALPQRDVVAWNTLIAGYSCQGDSELVFHLFGGMREDGIHPVGVTFLSVLSVCSHAGLVSKGREYFEAMSRRYGITPTVEHYTCMVDLLGRAGRLDEALDLVRSMRELPTASVWHTLLGACQKWSNVEVGSHAFNEAVTLDKRDAAAYVLMSNIYTGAQMWEQAQEMQTRRLRMKAWKMPGHSWWTDMDGLVHRFFVGNMNHPKSQAGLKQVLGCEMNGCQTSW